MTPAEQALKEHNQDMYLDTIQDELEKARGELAEAEAKNDWAAVAELNGYVARLEEMLYDISKGEL